MPEANISSPKWSPNTKLVVALTFVTIIAALIVRFSNILVPLLFTFIVSYLLHPVVSLLERKTKLSWRGAVSVIYIIFLILAVGFLVALGVAIVQQLLSLIEVINQFVKDLPAIASDISEQGFRITVLGFSLDLTQLIEQFDIDILGLSNQLLSVLQPILGQTANLLGAVATSTALLIGWGAFVLIVSYFLLADSGPVSKTAQNFEFPGIRADFSRMGRELGRIWNAFLRGQLFLFATAVVGSFIIMVIAGVENALGLAFLVGLGKFVPYLGPFVANIAVALVAFFQSSNYLNLEPLVLVLIVVGILFVMDQVFDNIIAPRLYGNVLGIHPAALLVTAIILASLIGLTGIILAAPVLASLQMFVKYAIRKMLDQNPWPEPEQYQVDIDFPFEEPIRRIIDRVKSIITRKQKK